MESESDTLMVKERKLQSVLANKPLSAEKMTAFVKRSNDLLGLLI